MTLPLLIGLLLGCRATLEPRVPAPPSDPSDAWEEVLARVVDERGEVDYAALEADREPLDRYVAWLATPDSMRGRGGTRAYAHWLNAFNALVLYQVLERGRPASVRDVPGWPAKGWGFFVWTAFPVQGGPPASLWEIGHERVLMAQQDYRSFAALSIGARSSPPLSRHLFRPETLDAQLDERFRAWMLDDRGVRLEGDQALFNPILSRYADEVALFTHQADLCALAAYHLDGPRKRALMELALQGCPHDFFPFDWALNDQRRAP